MPLPNRPLRGPKNSCLVIKRIQKTKVQRHCTAAETRGGRASLVDLLDLGASAAGSRGGVLVHAGAAHVAAGALVHLGDDGVAQALQLLHLVLELVRLRQLVGVQPLDGLVDGVLDLLLVLSGELGRDLLVLDRVAHVVRVVLQGVLGLHLLLVLLVLRLVLLRVLHHLLDLLLAQTALVVGDGDLVLLAGGLVLRRHVQDAVGVNVEAHRDLGHTTGSRGDAGELELAEEVVVAGPRPLTLVHLDQHTRLVVGVGGEHLLLLGGNGGVPRDQHDLSQTILIASKIQNILGFVLPSGILN
ncbi:hypothetical protein EJB05_00958, partial [Eragrostis curvula]